MAANHDPPMALRIHGMDCAEEVALLKRELLPLVRDDQRLGFDLLKGKLTVDLDNSRVSPDDVITAIRRTGLRAEVWREDGAEPSGNFWSRYSRAILTAASGLCTALGWAAQYWSGGTAAEETLPVLSIAFYTVAILAGFSLVLPKAWRSATSLRPDMNLLMTVAVMGAILIGEWLEGATVAFLFSFSLLLESWSIGRARRAIAALMDLSPPVARIRGAHGAFDEVPPSEVAVGTTFVVRPAEKIPLDGRVLSGDSAVNQSPITGESVPVEKSPGDEVFAGTINGDGLLEVTSLKPASDTTLARIIKMVGDAQSRRAPSEQWVEKFAAIYTPCVLVAAVLVLVVPPLALGADWSAWLYRALVLLVIACPCALVISTPVSIVAALASAAKRGVLIKGGVYAELPATLRAVAFDKTGTLTSGQPAVVEVVPMNGHDESELLTRASALEMHSNHPLARAIVEEARRRGIDPPEAEGFQTLPGKGAVGVVAGKRYWVGSRRYLVERGQETPDVHQQLESSQRADRSAVLVGNDQHVCGLITLADPIRDSAQRALADFRRLGIEHLVMLTGDNQRTAQAIATEAGIDEVHAELLPEDKVAVVETLVERYGQVAMVGDGINDAPALARASLGIAMGAAGSDAAIETADIALMSDDLAKLPWLIGHSRRTLRIIRQNIAFALGVKAIFVLLTVLGHASLWAAIAADTGASLLVIFNGLRLLRER